MRATEVAGASARDRAWMHRCIELAQSALGQTAPNPLVGSVVVQGEDLVGTGFHPGAGQPHAEVFALQAAGDRARGATLYVNLEPCNHYGRTPPCTEAVIQAGIQRVVIGMIDPDPRVAGQGMARLQTAGLEVTVGVELAACLRLNEAFSHRITHQRPFGIWKYAMTLDGKIATTTGHSAWVTGPAARQQVHQLRATCDAVIIGGNTVRQDNPYLTTHGVSDRQPLRVVMSRSLDLPLTANLWDTAIAPTLVCTAASPDPAHRDQQQALTDQGVAVLVLPDLTPDAVMAHLAQRGCNLVLWECGGTLAAAALRDRAVQRIWAFIAPKLIGGVSAPSPLGDLGLTEMTAALPLYALTSQAIGSDWLWDAYLSPPDWAMGEDA